MEAVEAGDIGTGHVLPDTNEGSTPSASVDVPSSSRQKENIQHENPHRYVRQQVPPSERSLRKPALRNDTPSQASLFSKRKKEDEQVA